MEKSIDELKESIDATKTLAQRKAQLSASFRKEANYQKIFNVSDHMALILDIT